MRYVLVGSLIFLSIFLSPASAFDLQHVDIRIDRQGDAIITLTYQDSPVEYLGIKMLAASSAPIIANYRRSHSGGSQQDIYYSVYCTSPGSAQLKASQFATVTGRDYATPSLDTSSFTAGSGQLLNNYGYAVDLKADARIVFPDGYTIERRSITRLDSYTHTLSEQRIAQTPAPSAACRKDKPLPLSSIIPDEAAPVVAVGTGIAMTGLGLTAFSSALSAWFAKGIVFIQNAIGQVIQGRLSEEEKVKRALDRGGFKETAFGFTPREIGVIAAGAGIIGILFFFAARTAFDVTIITIYVIMGGIALVMHELAHWYLNRRYQCSTEVQFWGTGATIMFITAWLFGNVFAQPTLTVVRSRVPLEKRSLGLIMLSGPIFSVLIAIACLWLIPLGGLFRTAGVLGFSINLLAGVFELLPVSPCDGKEIYLWNRSIWALVFIPLVLFYFIVTL